MRRRGCTRWCVVMVKKADSFLLLRVPAELLSSAQDCAELFTAVGEAVSEFMPRSEGGKRHVHLALIGELHPLHVQLAALPRGPEVEADTLSVVPLSGSH